MSEAERYLTGPQRDGRSTVGEYKLSLEQAFEVNFADDGLVGSAGNGSSLKRDEVAWTYYAQPADAYSAYDRLCGLLEEGETAYLRHRHSRGLVDWVQLRSSYS